jgi:hypothetical protein
MRSPCARRRKRVRLIVPQLGAQLPGPGVVHRASLIQHFFPAAALPSPRLRECRGGEKMRHPSARKSPHPQPLSPEYRGEGRGVSAREEASFVEDRLGAQ